MNESVRAWEELASTWLTSVARPNLRVLHYERLRVRTEQHLASVVHFLGLSGAGDLSARLACVAAHPEGNFNRPPPPESQA